MTVHLPPPSLADLEHPLVGALSIFAPGIAATSAGEAERDPDPRPPAPVRASAPGPHVPAFVRRPDRPRAA
ncbi:hypothetical protein [Streptomyces sp. NPDC057280]|uniref:hypothetical protein n=1 Tax=Streptomyces sp. NPDC057280 TaxID=3346081 RepID=UPI000FE1CA03